jgi:hypothetical protein
MRLRLLRLSTARSVFCAHFHVTRRPSSSLETQAPLANSASDRRLEIFFEQRRQPWNAFKQLDASIVVAVVPPGVETPTFLTFDAMSPPTPAHILSLLPGSVDASTGLKNDVAHKWSAPIAAAVNGRVVGLGRFAPIILVPLSEFSLEQETPWINLAGLFLCC